MATSTTTLTKSDMARQALKALGNDAKLGEVNEWITKKFGSGHELASGHFCQVRDEWVAEHPPLPAENSAAVAAPSANGHAPRIIPPTTPKVAVTRKLTPQEMMRLVKSCRVIINRLGKDHALRLMEELS